MRVAPPAPIRKGFLYHCLGCNYDSPTARDRNWILSDHISSVLRSTFSTSSVKGGHAAHPAQHVCCTPGLLSQLLRCRCLLPCAIGDQPRRTTTALGSQSDLRLSEVLFHQNCSLGSMVNVTNGPIS